MRAHKARAFCMSRDHVGARWEKNERQGTKRGPRYLRPEPNRIWPDKGEIGPLMAVPERQSVQETIDADPQICRAVRKAAYRWNQRAFDCSYPSEERVQLASTAVFLNYDKVRRARNPAAVAYRVAWRKLWHVYRDEFGQGNPREVQFPEFPECSDEGDDADRSIENSFDATTGGTRHPSPNAVSAMYSQITNLDPGHPYVDSLFSEARARIPWALGQLNERQQQVLFLHLGGTGSADDDGLSAKDISENTRIPLRTVYWTLQEAIRTLRHLLKVPAWAT